MKLFNTLTRQLETFEPQNPPAVSLYTCGPTVYDYPTIGNWMAYVRWDLLARVLRQQDYDLNWVMNITDVGHLVSDADEGEDKLEKGARREGKTAWEVADFYAADFIAGLKALNIELPLDHLVKATDHIPEQIDLIQQLESKGFTYRTNDGVYFDSTKFADYGKLAQLDVTGLQAGARVEQGEKHAPTDFALWKFSPEDAQRDMEWESPWGKGFPGWHIECSAMAMKYLGETIDIHAGGIDHIPVHHTNEIAQSEAATGKQFARFWLHSNFLTIADEKIAKSAGNGYTLQDVVAKGYSPAELRLFILQSHYRTQSNFTWENLGAAKQRLQRWQAVADLRWQQMNLDEVSSEQSEQAGQLEDATKAFQVALINDLDTPAALSALEAGFDAVVDGLSVAAESSFRQLLEAVRDLLGIDLLASPDITDEQRKLIIDRQAARAQQNWPEADKLRQQLDSANLVIRDTEHGSLWARKS